ncbi:MULTISPECIES: L-2-amino-thiazoline-4-carboxylic acid hydrolase [unclassified Saccharothrix]|uniref:L-2-amino-thiazoline-4-carboxylic acid hydrolase n=1 Tax=unclassified Saccharothrix TaxID=2593673 RepID=UPI00307E580D
MDNTTKPDHGDYRADAWMPVIEAAFFDRLLRLLGATATRLWPAPVDDLVRLRLGELEPELAHLITNEMDAANVRFTALAAATFEVLQPVCGDVKATAIVDECLNTPLRADIIEGTTAMLDHAPDPFTTLVEASRLRERTSFGPSFTFQRPVDDHDTYVLDVKRCLFHEALVAAGREHLQPVLCRFDLNWADAIAPERHHLRFIRPVTFATGTTCRMVFTRQENIPG